MVNITVLTLSYHVDVVDIGHIRSAIGLAHLLVNQRFKQFSGLIKNCEDQVTPKGIINIHKLLIQFRIYFL